MLSRSLAALSVIFALSALVLILQLYAMKYDLYWVLWWFGIPMHFVSGAIIAGGILWAHVRLVPGMFSRRQIFICAVGAALAIGIGWELLEYWSGMMAGPGSIVLDTLLDLVMDTLGAVAAFGIFALASRMVRKNT